ncbi:acyclic terpene utilization AtuA family protein [Phenylobacterium terrae]|uniref:Acyclic terpene utilization AtuA family protein n=1 Tax=Phenylobacterium terrae TaxID=2665495 RepID=A0ABW4N7R7_9CAUL
MTAQQTAPVTVLVPVGSLGAGVREEEVVRGLEAGAQVIASDAGSTDSGAAYLALGVSKNNRGAVKRDLEILMRAQARYRVPILIGTSGQAGGDLNVDWTRDIALEIAREQGLTPRIAVIYCEQDKATLKAKRAAGAITPLPPLGPLDEATIDACDHIVAVMGPEPFIAALEAGADIVLAGRTTDTAVLAAYPLWKGMGVAPAWHGAKVTECGAQCAARRRGSGVMFRVGADYFDVAPLDPDNLCTPHSVSAHMLYENSDPFRLVEPGGVLDVTDARYEQLDPRWVRVTGSRWEPRPYTMKLEGAAVGPCQTVMLIGIRDPEVLRQLDVFHDRMLAALTERARRNVDADPDSWSISLRIYGWNAVDGEPVPAGTPPPREVGILCVVTAPTQQLATDIAKACNPYFFHFPLNPEKELPSYAFAFSPADIERGPVFEFKLNHVVAPESPTELVRMEFVDLTRTEAA